MDFDYMESVIDKDTEMFILTNPDNPTGRVWSKDELERLAKLCKAQSDTIL